MHEIRFVVINGDGKCSRLQMSYGDPIQVFQVGYGSKIRGVNEINRGINSE